MTILSEHCKDLRRWAKIADTMKYYKEWGKYPIGSEKAVRDAITAVETTILNGRMF